jgi:PST family polysaccharide transporter
VNGKTDTRIKECIEEHQVDATHATQSAWSGIYSVLGRLSNVLTQVGSTIILARLLEPDDFGLFAMMAAVASLTPVVMDLGTRDVAVQKPRLTAGEVSALFWISVSIGIGFALGVMMARSFIADFYHDTRLIDIAAVWTLTFLFSSLSLQHTALLRRAMRFERLNIIEIGSNFVAAAGAIFLAWRGIGYWALVLRPIIASGLYTIGVWVSYPWRPGWPCPWADVRSMLTLGGQITGFSLLDALARSMDRIVLGRIGGASQVGYYNNGFNIYDNAIGIFGIPVHTVAVASLSKLRNMPEDLRHMWESGLQALTFFAMPVVVVLAVVGQDIAVVLLGEQWRLAGELLWIIALRGPAHVIERSHGWLHVVGGHGDRWVRWGIISCLVQLAAIACGAPFGATGIAVAGTIAIYLLFVPAIMFSAAPFGLGAKHLARTVGPQLLGALGTIVTMIMVREMYFVDVTSYERIAVVSLLSLIVYLVVTVGLFRVTKPLRYAWSLVRDKFRTGGPSSGDGVPCTN